MFAGKAGVASNNLTNLKKNLVYNFLLSCSRVLLPVVTIPYLSVVLDPDGIGKVGFIDSLTWYFVSIAEFGIITYGIREVARAKDDKAALEKLVSELLVLHVISSCFSLLLYSIAVATLWQKIGDIRLVLFSFSFLLVNFFSCEWYFRGIEQFRYITIRSLITRVLGLISIFILVKKTDDYYLYYATIAGSAAANGIWNQVVLFRSLRISYRKVDWRRHLRKTWVTWVISLLYSATIMLDTVLLRIVSTSVAVGWYVFAARIIRMGGNLITDIFPVLYPRIVTLLNEGKAAEAQQTILKSVQLILLLAVPASVGTFLLADPFVHIFFDEAFQPVANNLKILAIVPLIKAYSLLLSNQVLIPFNHEKLYMKSLLTGNVFFVSLVLILASSLNDQGASIAVVITELIILVCNYYYAKQTNPSLRIFDGTVCLQAFAGALLFIPVIYLLQKFVQSPLSILLLAVVICTPLYFAFQVFVMKNQLITGLYRKRWASTNRQ